MARLRLLPLLIGVMAILAAVKAQSLWLGARTHLAAAGLVGRAQAADPAPAAAASAGRPAALPPAERPAALPVSAPTAGAAVSGLIGTAPEPVAEAERRLLAELRARRAELAAREQAIAAQEVMLRAAEQRLARRLEELEALQQRLEALERARIEREEAGWRGIVRTYEAMRPRDAAAIFDELELPVLIEILDRMGERKAAPVIGAMRPDRARLVTAELARHRARRTAAD